MNVWGFLALLLIVMFITMFAIAIIDVAPVYAIGFGVAVVIGTVPVLIHIAAQKIKTVRLAPAREEQLKSLKPEALFFSRVRPYFNKKYANVEQKLKLRGEISEIARELGLDGDPKKHDSHYYWGRKAVEEAQEKYLLDQEKGNLVLFYLRVGKELSVNMDMKMIESSLQSNSITPKVVDYARIYGVIDAPYRKNCMSLNDEQKLAALNAVREGQQQLRMMAAKKDQPFPPYYPVWLFIDKTDEYRKKDSDLFEGA